MHKWKTHKWEIYWVLERNIKFYEGINNEKKRPVIIISNSILLVNRYLIIECSSHKIDDYSILISSYTNSKGENKENWALPNRIHTLNVHEFKHENRIRSKVPVEARGKIITYFTKTLDIVTEQKCLDKHKDN